MKHALPCVSAFSVLLVGPVCARAADPVANHLNTPQRSVPTRARAAQEFGRGPLSFEVNQGQADPQVRYLSRGDGYSLALTPTEAVLALQKPGCSQPALARPVLPSPLHSRPRPCAPAAPASVLRMQLLGGNPAAQIAAEDELPSKTNYFIGKDPGKWRTNISTYNKVQYRNIYPDIDLVYYGNQRQLEHDFVVAPGADPRTIKLRFTGARRISLNRNGDLVLSTHDGNVTLKQPVVYQTIAGIKHPVQGHYQLQARNQVGFAVANYDHTQPLIIDPVLVFSSYFGGASNATLIDGWLNGVAVDVAGAVYISGYASPGLPIVNALYPTPPSNQSHFVSKLTPDGVLVYSTYLGDASGLTAPPE